MRSSGETLAGIQILDEWPNALGLILWLHVNDVSLWASTPTPARNHLFGLCSPLRLSATDSDVPVALSESLTSLSVLLSLPPDADAELVATCCLEVAAWARRSAAPRTALAFAQAGALAAPDISEPAVLTAMCALDVQEPVRAETWLRRAIAVARRERNWPVYATAYVLLGNICRERGNVSQAERYLLMGFRMGRRAAVHSARRDAAHGLFRLAVERGDVTTATRFASAAMGAYGKEQTHSSAHRLLLDVARFWIDAGQPTRARRALGRLAFHVGELSHDDTIAAAAMTSRVLAEGDARRSAAAEARACRMLARETTPDDVAFAAAVDLAHGAAIRRDRHAFDRATRAALRLAARERYDWTRNMVAALTRDAFPPAEGAANG
jgi:hypothetical protein